MNEKLRAAEQECQRIGLVSITVRREVGRMSEKSGLDLIQEAEIEYSQIRGAMVDQVKAKIGGVMGGIFKVLRWLVEDATARREEVRKLREIVERGMDFDEAREDLDGR